MNKPPKTGLYVSQVDSDIRLVVKEVNVIDDEVETESECFFLVEVVKERDAGNASAIVDELDPDEWENLVFRLSLKFIK